MNLPRKRERPRRKQHPIQPAWSATPIPDEQSDPERWDPAYRAAVAEAERRAYGRCEARLDGCTTRGQHPHHIIPVSEGGRTIVPAAWLRWVCPQCHGRIHSANDRTFAEKLGLIWPRPRL